MKIPLSWLKEFVDIEVSVDELAYRLTMAGIETRPVRVVSVDKNVVVAKILSVEKHPNADKLSVCEVTDGQNNYKIVCGAKNIKSGDIVPLAKIGATFRVPAVEIKKVVIRGVESQGMLCSSAEIKFGDDASGIFILPDDAKIGLSLDEYLNNDQFIETETTINRGDCLSVFGIAREISAVFNKKLKKEIKNDTFAEGKSVTLNSFQGLKNQIKLKNIFPVEVKNPDKCPRYVGFIIKNIKVGLSPQWLVDRLTNCGLRPINNIVDITNYILLEYGQPLHAFDMDKLENKIIVRHSKNGEKILALDNKEYILDEEMLVIADEQMPIAIAGVIGGLPTSVTDTTKNIFLEAACFDPISIRKTSRKLAISTESSYRFIRGIDAKNVSNICVIAAEMIQKICGGSPHVDLGQICGDEIVEGAVDIYPTPQESIKIELDAENVNKILGTDIVIEEMQNILSRLGFSFQLLRRRRTYSATSSPVVNLLGNFQLIVSVPSHRNDVKSEIDLVEEIARIYGYNNIKTSDKIVFVPTNRGKNYPELVSGSNILSESEIQKQPVEQDHGDMVRNDKVANKTEQVIDRIKNIAVECGFFETVNYNFVSKKDLLKLKLKESEWEIKNPISMEKPFLTTSLIPQLIENAIRNFSRGRSDIKFFEIGKVFLDTEKTFFSGCVSGCKTRWWKEKPSSVDFYFLSGFIETILTEIGISNFRFEKSDNETFHKNQSAKIVRMDPFGKISGQTIGYLGLLNPDIKSELDLKTDLYIFEIVLDELVDFTNFKKTYLPIPRFPSVERDIAIEILQNFTADEITGIIKKEGGDMLSDIKLFDFYSGEQVKAGHKSLAFNMTFICQDRTLKDEEVNGTIQKIISQLGKKFGAKIR
ncbi:MAG: phenylalanine--tRNA ligase subunit beta [Elusimicrobiota bacterium]